MKSLVAALVWFILFSQWISPDIVKKIEKILEEEHLPAQLERFKIKHWGTINY